MKKPNYLHLIASFISFGLFVYLIAFAILYILFPQPKRPIVVPESVRNRGIMGAPEASSSAIPKNTPQEDYLVCHYYWIRDVRNDMDDKCLHHMFHWDQDPNYYGEEL